MIFSPCHHYLWTRDLGEGMLLLPRERETPSTEQNFQGFEEGEWKNRDKKESRHVGQLYRLNKFKKSTAKSYLAIKVKTVKGEISSDLYRLFVCDIEKSNY